MNDYEVFFYKKKLKLKIKKKGEKIVAILVATK
jgi:hypothetical protein